MPKRTGTHGGRGAEDAALIVGSGALARAVAAELATQYQVVIVDDSAAKLGDVQLSLGVRGHFAQVRTADVVDASSISGVLSDVAGMGPLKAFVYAATVCPDRLSVRGMLRRTLYGASLWIEQCAEHIAPGGAAVVLACVSGHWARINSDDESALGHVPAADLLDLPFLNSGKVGDPLVAYRLAQRGIQMRARAAAPGWATRRQARINSVSGGGSAHRYPLAAIDAGRRFPGAVHIAVATACLLSGHASYICGADVSVDNGANAAHWVKGDVGDPFEGHQPVVCGICP